MKSSLAFLFGWFLATFSTHYFGWKSATDAGGVLILFYILYLIFDYAIEEGVKQDDK